MTATRQILISIGSILVIALAVILISPSCVGEREKKQASELRRIASEIEPYPAAKATGEKVVFKSELVYLFTYYETGADFSEVKDFYDAQLTGKGWTRMPSPTSILVGEADWRRYQKGDYAVVVERDDNQPSHFDLAFEWNAD